jgi:hypothetical protein
MNNMGFITHSEKISELAATVEDNGGCVFVTAFSGLFAPYWIDDAKVGSAVSLEFSHVEFYLQSDNMTDTYDRGLFSESRNTPNEVSHLDCRALNNSLIQ